MMTENITYMLVEDEEAIREAVHMMERSSVLAVDLEMENNFHRYGTHLGLIQVSDGKNIWLIDPLKINDCSPLCRIFESAKIQKVFHDPDFDLRVLDLTLSCHPKNIFDTKIACELLGREHESLSSLLEEMFGIKKDTKMQKVDWTKRPLDKRMLKYAATDVLYLIKVKENLEKELVSKGRMEWAQEEFKLLEKIRHKERDAPYLFKGTKSMNGRERAILHKLFECREEIAKKRDIPVFRVMDNKRLIELAKNPPAKSDWKNIGGVSWLVKKYYWKFADAVKNGMKSIPEERPKGPVRIDTTDRKLLEGIKEERNKIAEEIAIKPYVLMNTTQMEEIARGGNPQSVLKKWQFRILSGRNFKFK